MRPPVDVVVEAMRWYAETVYSGRVVSHALGGTERGRLVVFSDASGDEKARAKRGIGAIVWDPATGKSWWVAAKVPEEFFGVVPKRAGQKIHYYELYGAVAAVDMVTRCTVGGGEECPAEWRGVEEVVLFCDNSSAVWNLINGFSRRPASNAFLFEFYKRFATRGVGLTVEHIAGDLNPADDPSRLGEHVGDAEFEAYLNAEYGERLDASMLRVPWLSEAVVRMATWSASESCGGAVASTRAELAQDGPCRRRKRARRGVEEGAQPAPV